jgi:hypothetical protein
MTLSLALFIAFIVILFGSIWVAYYRDVNHIAFISKEYDEILNKLIDKKTPLKIEYGMVIFEGTSERIWVCNYPYAYGSVYTSGQDIYPTMKTRKKLKNYIQYQNVKNFMIKDK